MTKDEIMKLAQQAGMETHERKQQIRIGSAILTGCDSTEQVLLFAELVAEAERKACANACKSSVEGWEADTPWGRGYLQAVRDVEEGIRARGEL